MGNDELVLNQAVSEDNARIIGFSVDSLKVAERTDILA
jgi:hypothetical protein